MNINNALDKAYEGKSFKELLAAPVASLQGISDAGAEDLKRILKIKTIEDLANSKYFKWAAAIQALAASEE